MKKIAQVSRLYAIAIERESSSNSLTAKEQLEILQELKEFLQKFNKEDNFDIRYDEKNNRYYIIFKKNIQGYLLLNSQNEIFLYIENKYNGMIAYIQDTSIEILWSIIYYDINNYILFLDKEEDGIVKDRQITFSILKQNENFFWIGDEDRFFSYSDTDYYYIMSSYPKGISIEDKTFLCPIPIRGKVFKNSYILSYLFYSSKHKFTAIGQAENQSYEYFKIKNKYIFLYYPTVNPSTTFCFLIGVNNE